MHARHQEVPNRHRFTDLYVCLLSMEWLSRYIALDSWGRSNSHDKKMIESDAPTLLRQVTNISPRLVWPHACWRLPLCFSLQTLLSCVSGCEFVLLVLCEWVSPRKKQAKILLEHQLARSLVDLHPWRLHGSNSTRLSGTQPEQVCQHAEKSQDWWN
jgi:hypothetical protein